MVIFESVFAKRCARDDKWHSIKTESLQHVIGNYFHGPWDLLHGGYIYPAVPS